MRVSPLMFIVLLVLVACTAEPQAPEGRTDLLLTDYAGDWEGTLNAGGQALPLVLHVDPEASPQVTMDSPAQGANGISASEVSVEEGALRARALAGQLELGALGLGLREAVVLGVRSHVVEVEQRLDKVHAQRARVLLVDNVGDAEGAYEGGGGG